MSLRDVLAGPSAQVAPLLLGTHLTCERDGATVTVRVTEVEAYAEHDPASHTFRGPTTRNRIMFAEPGHAYVYRSHGIHACLNVVCGPAGTGAAVLVRGGEVVAGRDVATARRGGRGGDAWLAAGPGRLCQALGVTLDDDGAWLLGEGHLRLEPPPEPETRPVRRGPRVGVSQAADVHWRFWLEGAPGVSRYRRSPRAPRPQPRRGAC